MEDPERVGGVEGEGDLPHDVEREGEGDLAAAEEAREGLAVDELHRDEVPRAVLADLVDADDVRVVEARCGEGLPAEALEGLGRGVLAGEEDLDGDDAAQVDVARSVDDAHPAAGDLALDQVRPEAVRQRRADGVRNGHGRGV